MAPGIYLLALSNLNSAATGLGGGLVGLGVGMSWNAVIAGIYNLNNALSKSRY